MEKGNIQSNTKPNQGPYTEDGRGRIRENPKILIQEQDRSGNTSQISGKVSLSPNPEGHDPQNQLKLRNRIQACGMVPMGSETSLGTDEGAIGPDQYAE